MCGACGRTVVADAALGPVRTTRDLLVVAQVVNSVVAGLPGGPVVRVSGDAWILAGRTGTTTACDTVHQLWSDLLDCCARTSGASSYLTRQIARALPAASPLADRVLRAGITAGDRR